MTTARISDDALAVVFEWAGYTVECVSSWGILRQMYALPDCLNPEG